MQDRVWGEKEMGLRTESWRTLTVVGAEEQKERGSRKAGETETGRERKREGDSAAQGMLLTPVGTCTW